MRRLLVLVGVMMGVAGAMLSAPTTTALAAAFASPSNQTVFVQTNDPLGNSIVAYQRHPGGTLSVAAIYSTGGDGGRESGAMSDPLASQGSLVFDPTHSLLFAVNAGSNTVAVFGVQGDVLHLHQVIGSGGAFPVGFALHGNLLYVLNAGLTGDVSGFRIAGGRLSPIAGSTRSLGLVNGNPPFFLTSPGEVGFTPSGSQLVVTTKANGTVDVFAVNRNGGLSPQPVKNAVGGAPFSFRFEAANLLALVNAGTSSVGTYAIHPNGTLTPVHAPVTDGQVAACWITRVRGFDYVANTGSGTISQYRVSSGGNVRLVNPAAAAGIAGPTDMATAGTILYNESGLSSTVEVFAVGAGGALTLVQSEPVPDGASQEGIVAA